MEDSLDIILRPLAVGEFMATHWERAAVHVRGDVGRFEAVFDVADWHARRSLGPTDAAKVDERGRQHQRRVAMADVDALLAAGQTICADVSTHPRIGPLLATLRSLVPSAESAFAKLYASPPGVGFAVHMDAHHVFVLQLEGRKRWTYSPRPAVTAPLWGGKIDEGRAVHTFPRDGSPIAGDDGRALAVPREDELVTVDLAPGDSLYLPPGSWHTTSALEASVAVSVSPPRSPALAFVLRVLEQQLAMDPALRRDLVRRRAGAGPVPAELRKGIDGALEAIARLAGGMDRRVLHRAWALQAHAREDVVADAEPSHGAIRRKDVLEHADARGFEWIVARIENAEQVCLYGGGAEWTLPIDARGFIEEMAKQTSFTAETALSWDRRLDWNGAREFLEQLVGAGIVRVRRSS